jgi:hypothetical protein
MIKVHKPATMVQRHAMDSVTTESEDGRDKRLRRHRTDRAGEEHQCRAAPCQRFGVETRPPVLTAAIVMPRI